MMRVSRQRHLRAGKLLMRHPPRENPYKPQGSGVSRFSHAREIQTYFPLSIWNVCRRASRALENRNKTEWNIAIGPTVVGRDANAF